MNDVLTGCPERALEPPEGSARANRLYDMAEELRDIRILMDDCTFFKELLRGAYWEAFAQYQEEMTT